MYFKNSAIPPDLLPSRPNMDGTFSPTPSVQSTQQPSLSDSPALLLAFTKSPPPLTTAIYTTSSPTQPFTYADSSTAHPPNTQNGLGAKYMAQPLLNLGFGANIAQYGYETLIPHREPGAVYSRRAVCSSCYGASAHNVERSAG